MTTTGIFTYFVSKNVLLGALNREVLDALLISTPNDC